MWDSVYIWSTQAWGIYMRSQYNLALLFFTIWLSRFYPWTQRKILLQDDFRHLLNSIYNVLQTKRKGKEI